MKKKAKKVIVDVVPLTKIPLSKGQSFSYLFHRELAPGTLVTVPLFKRKIRGVVIAHRADFHRLGNIELKNIESVEEENFLTPEQMALAQFISDYYFSPLGVILKSFTPTKVKTRHPKPETYHSELKRMILTPEQKSAINKITSSKTTHCQLPTTNYLLFGPSASGKTEVYLNAIKKLRQKNPDRQFLILLPELTLTPQAIERYGAYFPPEEVAVLNSKIAKGKFYANWERIKSGQAKIIIGSRLTVFAPFKKLGLIVIDEEQDISFKQWEMNPRYDARQVAKKLADLHGCHLVFGSATPRLESHAKALSGEYALLKLSPLKTTKETAIELVDMKKERWIKNYSPISKKLEAEIAYALKNKLQTILFINRQGMSSFSVCADCKTVLRCPECDRALVYDSSGSYRCIHCTYRTSILPKCSQCGGLSFTNIGLGTQKVEREVENIFAGARIKRVDQQTMQKAGAAETVYREFAEGKIDILIGTQMISKGWDLPNVALVGIIDADNMLSIPDFSTAEKAFQTILQVAGRVNRPGAKFPGRVLIQTFRPEQDFFKLIAEKNIEKFLEKELLERKNLGLPPFGKIIKLIHQDYDSKRAEKEAARIYTLLENGLPAEIRLTEPQDAFVAKVRGRFRKQIILKYPQAFPLPEETRRLLENLPSGWIIDVDPISLI